MGRNQMGSSKSSDGFIDRGKVRILLCENDGRSSEEVFTLLCKCSYQVTSVRSPRQVIDALNAEGPEIDIILSEVDLPMAKGFKMLKYITRDKELRRIPVIMMSAQDEVSVVVKCLRLGAADYLVKPLRTNELLNLWTHMWRRRRMLGLQEKNILNYDFDLVASDPSDTNTNSTTLFSDDTDDKSRKSANPDTCVSNQLEYETDVATIAAPIETPLVGLSVYQPDVHGTSHRWRGPMSSCPKKSELKIGESSAFFTYVKSSMFKIDSQGVVPVTVKAQQQLRVEKKLSTWGGRTVDSDTQGNANQEAQENHSQADEFLSGNSIPDSFSGFNPHMPYPYYISGLMNQVMMPSTAYQKNLQDLQKHAPNTPMLPQYNHIPNCPPHMSGIASFPYYPCPPPSQMPADHHPWQSHGSSSPSNGNMSKVDRRDAALLKFRQKRKERCFDKKIRYVNRKRLAEKRARVRGQFARKIGGLNVDLNGQPASADYDDDDDEEEEDEED